jgi:hypothetical protein
MNLWEYSYQLRTQIARRCDLNGEQQTNSQVLRASMKRSASDSDRGGIEIVEKSATA